MSYRTLAVCAGFSTILAAALLGAGSGCQAGVVGIGGSGDTSTGANLQSSSNGFSSGTEMSTGTSLSNCTDPTCVGSTPQGGCDGALALAANDPMDGARAIGLCKEYTEGTWGVRKAEWIRADGSPLGMGDGGQDGDGDLALGKGIVSKFGSAVTPREGKSMLVLSSGSARNPNQPGYHSVSGYWKDNNEHGAPNGYPKASASCDLVGGPPYDSAGLRLQIATPTDAKSISFNIDFYTYEFPNFVCDKYNDFFTAIMSPAPAGLPDGNISFDSMKNTISVNAGFLTVCHPQQASNGQNFACPDGPGELAGTGFDVDFLGDATDNSAATSWLQTNAPIANPGSDITLEFAIWDDGDGVLDSTILIDNFTFTPDLTDTGTTPVPK
ncbi:MAG: choice-of-anchor L domain-containing protein [Polyangiaceae bacterium]